MFDAAGFAVTLSRLSYLPSISRQFLSRSPLPHNSAIRTVSWTISCFFRQHARGTFESLPGRIGQDVLHVVRAPWSGMLQSLGFFRRLSGVTASLKSGCFPQSQCRLDLHQLDRVMPLVCHQVRGAIPHTPGASGVRKEHKPCLCQWAFSTSAEIRSRNSGGFPPVHLASR